MTHGFDDACLELVPNTPTDVLITIRPEHARAIYNGSKKFELRKSLPKTMPRRIILYETNGQKKITGHVIVKKIYRGSPAAVWEIVRGGGTPEDRFNQYFEGCTTAVAFEIETAQRYRHPLSIDEIQRAHIGFRPPQNFLYLDNFPDLYRALLHHAFEECVASVRGPVQLRVFEDSHAKRFIRAVEQHISGAYLETGRKYALALIAENSSPSDSEGIYTLRKRILAIYRKKNFIGFTVITEKIGGSFKTGPSILFKKYRDKGIGRQLRQSIKKFGYNYGFRKIYCTVPADNIAAIGYLTSSGYKIEAHLRFQYHNGHDEFVFGLLLSSAKGEPIAFERQLIPPIRFVTVHNPDLEVMGFLRSQFSHAFAEVDDEWAARQLRLATSNRQSRGAKFKQRRLFAGYSTHLVSCALCSLKRGGAVKIILLSQTAHVEGITRFIDFVETEVRNSKAHSKIRKFYSHVPLTDSDTTAAFVRKGYQVEGVLSAPYRPSDDLLVLGRML